MRKLVLVLLTFFIGIFSTQLYAQTITNKFPENGNVGIGTTTPGSKLDIQNRGDGASLIRLNTERPWDFLQTGTGATSNLVLRSSVNSKNFIIESPLGIRNTEFRVDDTPSSNRVFLCSDGGNVGIGTNSPRYFLDIRTNSSYEGNNIYFGDRRFYLAGLTGNGTQMYGGFILNNFGSGKRAFEVVVDHDNDFNTNKSPAKYIAAFLSNGNVGIGERDPKYKLTVSGIVSASEVKVSTIPNSDYVFEPDYNLKSLQEVESFIQQNKHLPDIPSAEEFKANGVGLGEMDNMLLMKVEELTLYTLEQQKELEATRKEVDDLRKIVEMLVNKSE